MPDAKYEHGVRVQALTWAISTATSGEHCALILARAELYTTFMMAPLHRQAVSDGMGQVATEVVQ